MIGKYAVDLSIVIREFKVKVFLSSDIARNARSVRYCLIRPKENGFFGPE